MKLFQKVKTIKSKTGELHFERWAIIETKWFALYVHKIHKEDKDYYLHSHPWNYISLILKGAYVEAHSPKFLDEPVKGFMWPQFTYRGFPFFLSWSNTERVHKIQRIVNGPVTTLFFVWGKTNEWFYQTEFCRLSPETYREIKNTTGIEEWRKKMREQFDMSENALKYAKKDAEVNAYLEEVNLSRLQKYQMRQRD